MKNYAEVFAILSFEGLQNAFKKTANILSIYSVNLQRPTKKNFVKRQRMLNRFGVKSGALSLKMDSALPN